MFNNTYPTYPMPEQLAMQERLRQMQQYRPAYSGIKGRMVASVDEARAAQIDFDGSLNFFPCPAEKKIYVKSIGLDGLPVFEVYSLAGNGQPVYVENTVFKALENRVAQIEAVMKGANNNVQPDAINANNE